MDKNTGYFIELWRKRVEQQLAWGPVNQWKQRDFEQLRDLIFEKTATRLSLSTIRRIWSGTSSKTPQTATLNAMAQFAGYRTWNDFRASSFQKEEQKTGSEKPPDPMRTRKIFMLVGSGLLLLLLSLIIFTSKKSDLSQVYSSTDEKATNVNFTHKVLADGVPNTVVFSFDIAKAGADSFFFQQTWDYQTRVLIPAGSKNFTSVYYYPGYHIAKLFAGKNQIAEDRIHIKTNGWLSMVVAGSSQAIPAYFRDTINDGMLYLPVERLPKSEQLENKKEFFVRYYNIRDFDSLSGDNFILKARVRNDLAHGALTCQDIRFYVFCESGMIIFPVSTPGCVGNLNLVAGNNFITGRNNDLSALGIDLSVWQNIKLSSIQKSISITTNKTSFSTQYTKSLNRIMGVMIEFKGTGALDSFQLLNAAGSNVYKDDF